MKVKNDFKTKSVAAQFSALKRAHGHLALPSTQRPIDVLVRTILSQNTTDTNSDKAYRLMRNRFPKWDDVANGTSRSLANIIRCGGLANIKADRIIKTLKTIRKQEGKLSLARLKTLNTSNALSYLISLPGVGVKTACCVLLFAFGMPVMPVDTHVHRIVIRLGWVAHKTHIDEIHWQLERIVPKSWILPLHLYLIRHGRTFCRARKPQCGLCVLAEYCAFFRIAE